MGKAFSRLPYVRNLINSRVVVWGTLISSRKEEAHAITGWVRTQESYIATRFPVAGSLTTLRERHAYCEFQRLRCIRVINPPSS